MDYPQFRPFSTAPPLLGKILEKKEAGEAGVSKQRESRQAGRACWGAELVPTEGKSQVTWAARAGAPAQGLWFWKVHLPPIPIFWKGSGTG